MELKEKITNMVNQVDGDVGIYIKSVNEEEEIVINGDKQFITASVFKIFCVCAIFLFFSCSRAPAKILPAGERTDPARFMAVSNSFK